MSIARKYQTYQLHTSELIIKTQKQKWVIPNSAIIMKALVQDQRIKSNDLQFSCDGDCQTFIKKLLILALEDEHKNHQPSPLAELARALIQSQTTNDVFN